MTEKLNTLILSLGATPDVFRTSLLSFKQEFPAIVFDEIVVICNTNLEQEYASAQLDAAIESSGVDSGTVTKLFTNSDDLITKEENLEFFKIVFGCLEKAKERNVYVNIAGGRKQMSALLLSAAYLSGVKRIFHTYHKRAEDDQPEEYSLVEIPSLRIDRLLHSVVSEFDRENRFDGSIAKLIEQVQTEEVFQILNKYLDDQSRFRSLREEFRKRRRSYESVLNSAELIVRNMLEGKLMFGPQYQSRTKDFESFYKKLEKKELGEGTISDPFSRFSDFAGLRVIFYNSADLYSAVKLIEDSNNFVNYMDGSKLIGDDKSDEYGYRAVHFDSKLNPEKRAHLEEYKSVCDVPCEMQFTTVFAHAWSKTYHALSYKDKRDKTLTPEQQKELDNGFISAAKNLKQIEDEITKLSKEFHPRS